MPNIQLVYVSKAADGLTDLDVLDILEKAQARNHSLKISGMLLFDGVRFMQLLEGDADTVEDLFQAISWDSRHCDVQLIGRFSIEKPAMPTWAMAYFRDTEALPSSPPRHFVMNKCQTREVCRLIMEPLGPLLWDAVNGIYPKAGVKLVGAKGD